MTLLRFLSHLVSSPESLHTVIPLVHTQLDKLVSYHFVAAQHQLAENRRAVVLVVFISLNVSVAKFSLRLGNLAISMNIFIEFFLLLKMTGKDAFCRRS